MPTRKKSRSQDRKRVSAQPHEVRFASENLGPGGVKAVKNAKKRLGRTTARTAVLKKAKELVGRIRKATAKSAA